MKLTEKRYLRMQFELASSMSIGSGNNDQTDSDVLRDSRGIPYIPGTAAAGATRHVLEDNGIISRKEGKKLFGDVSISKDTDGSEPREDAKSSRIIFTDSLMDKDSEVRGFHVSTRDQVALDEFKTARTGAKFDMEVLEPGVRFTIIIEENIPEGDDADQKILDLIAEIWKRGLIRFGTKTTRGYGQIRVLKTETCHFDFSNAEEIERWLDFDPATDHSPLWKDHQHVCISAAGNVDAVLHLELSQMPGSGISIRRYSTEVGNDNGAAPDFLQMTSHNSAGESVPVIPGTSWAGAFHHHMSSLFADHAFLEDYYGKAGQENDSKTKVKSLITFSESFLEGAKPKVLSRNAIDRFSGGAADTALYTEQTYYGGRTILTISLKKPGTVDDDENEKFLNALAASAADLDAGILSVGGETAIGRGLFQVNAVNGRKVNGPEEVYAAVLQELKEGAGNE